MFFFAVEPVIQFCCHKELTPEGEAMKQYLEVFDCIDTVARF